jgi:hypothetical protein
LPSQIAVLKSSIPHVQGEFLGSVPVQMCHKSYRQELSTSFRHRCCLDIILHHLSEPYAHTSCSTPLLNTNCFLFQVFLFLSLNCQAENAGGVVFVSRSKRANFRHMKFSPKSSPTLTPIFWFGENFYIFRAPRKVFGDADLPCIFFNSIRQ